MFAREATLGGRLGRAGEAKLGLWWSGMSNKGAVGVRVPVRRGDDGGWEVLTYVISLTPRALLVLWPLVALAVEADPR